MLKINTNPGETDREGLVRPIVEGAVPAVVSQLGFIPIMIVGVNRKINIGSFENVDVYAGITVPINYSFNEDDIVKFRYAAEEAAKIGFAIVSKETNERYNLIKNNQSGGRPQ